MKNVKVQRQGSLIQHVGRICVTNYRLVVIANSHSKIRPGDKSISALECPHMCVDAIYRVGKTITIHTKDFRNIVVDLSAIPEPRVKHFQDTIHRLAMCDEDEVFAFHSYLDALHNPPDDPFGFSRLVTKDVC